jgi:hypothetical protein
MTPTTAMMAMSVLTTPLVTCNHIHQLLAPQRHLSPWWSVPGTSVSPYQQPITIFQKVKSLN